MRVGNAPYRLRRQEWRSRPLPSPISKSTRTQSSGIQLPKSNLSETSSLSQREPFQVSSQFFTCSPCTSLRLIDCLNPADIATSPSLKASQDSLRIEAAHVVASLSYGLSRNSIIQPLLTVIQDPKKRWVHFWEPTHTMPFSMQSLISQRQTLHFSVRPSHALYEHSLSPSLILSGLRCGDWKRTILSFEMRHNKRFNSFFRCDPSFFSLLITFLHICYRLKPSIYTFPSSFYQLLQLLKPLFPLLFSQ